LVACGNGDDEPGTKGPEKIVYAGSAWPGHAPVWVGIKLGIFKKHGFEVDDRSFGGSADRVAALAAGNATFASLGEVAMLGAMAAGNKGFYWIANQNIAPGNEGLVAIGVDRIEDLKGKKIALYELTSIHLTIALLLKEHGLSLDDVEVLRGEETTLVNMLRNGDAVAAGIWEPFYSDMKKLPGAKVLGTDKDTSIYKRFKTMSGPDVVCCARKWFDDDPDRARRFFRAYFEAVEWCADHPAELVDIAVERTGKEKAIVAATMANFTWIGWDAQKVNMSDKRMFGQAQVAAELLVEMGKLDKVPAFRDWTRADLFWEK
jgi:ABC-type nitrate/sulfonate/bicarbonate transport system substrate-binding protein